MTPRLESLTGVESREVQIRDLEKELSALWRSLAAQSEGGEAVTRAAALTLLVYVENEEAAMEVGNLLGSISAQNPCRAVIMIAQPDASPAGFKASISAQCHLSPSSRRQVCCEQIRVVACGTSVGDLDHVVLPLTVSGLPVYLWWRTSRFDPPQSLGQMLRISDRVIVDSARFGDPEADLLLFAKRLEDLSDHVAFLDLNWPRITPWRELIAQCFDLSGTRDYIGRLRRVRIEYEERSSRLAAQTVQALLLAGWLASRLKWTRADRPAEVKSGRHSVFMKSNTGDVEIQRVARRFEGDGRGVCFRILLETSGEPSASFTLERGADGRSVHTRSELQGRLPIARTVRLEVLGEAELVNEELQHPQRDKSYEDALAMVIHILNK